MDGHTQSLVGIVSRLQAGCSRNTGSISAGGGRTYFLLQSFHTDWGLQPASYSIGIGGLIPWVKRPDREADRSPPSSSNSKVKIEWNYTFIHPYTFMACIGMLYVYVSI